MEQIKEIQPAKKKPKIPKWIIIGIIVPLLVALITITPDFFSCKSSQNSNTGDKAMEQQGPLVDGTSQFADSTIIVEDVLHDSYCTEIVERAKYYYNIASRLSDDLANRGKKDLILAHLSDNLGLIVKSSCENIKATKNDVESTLNQATDLLEK